MRVKVTCSLVTYFNLLFNLDTFCFATFFFSCWNALISPEVSKECPHSFFFFFNQNPCPNLAFCCGVKCRPKAIWWRFDSLFQVPTYHSRKAQQEFKQRQRQAPRRDAAYWLAPCRLFSLPFFVCLNLFFCPRCFVISYHYHYIKCGV